MENKRKLNVSGYRGVWGETLTNEIVSNYALAFARFTKEETKKENPTILIGRDGRESGPVIKEIIIKKLKSVGIRALDGDILPTPTVLFSVRKNNYDGAIIITASHNPIEYNGLKFVNKNALFTIEEEVERIEKYYEEESKIDNNRSEENRDEYSSTEDNDTENPNFLEDHANNIIENINVELIRSKKFKAVVDTINASASVLDPYLFEKLGVEMVHLNSVPNGKFNHKPEPLRENLIEVENVAKEIGADVGFVHDPDADRLVLIDEKGQVVSEEYTLVLAIENILSKNKGSNIVLNLSTSQTGADVAQKYESKVYRTKIGEGFVVDGILKHNAIIGGEGNGGVIYPKINTCRDSFVAIALILELLAEREKTLSELISDAPKYFIRKDKWPTGKDMGEIYLKLKEYFIDAMFDEQDGIRFDFPDKSWIHLRPSNTEPIIRLFGEAKNEERINALFEEAKKIIL